MLERFFPDLMLDRVQDIDLDILKRENIKGLILDIDNTLVPHGKEADEKAVAWVEKVKASGFKVCIVSNASNKRVIKFNERLKVFAIHRASKPGSKAFLKAVRLMDIKPAEAAVVGDQIFTDVYGGNKLNMFTILVKPIDRKELFFIRFKRIAERFVLSKYKMEFMRTRGKRVLWKKKSAGKRHVH